MILAMLSAVGGSHRTSVADTKRVPGAGPPNVRVELSYLEAFAAAWGERLIPGCCEDPGMRMGLGGHVIAAGPIVR